MQTDNCAILTPDVLADLAWLLDSRRTATPAEFHALNSLVEAVVFHEQLYLYDLPTNYTPSPLYDRLLKENIIFTEHSATVFETELESRQMEDVARDVLLDRTYGNSVLAYDPDGGVATLSSLIEYEEHLGFARMSQMHDDNQELAILLANALKFNRNDAILVDDTYDARGHTTPGVKSALGSCSEFIGSKGNASGTRGTLCK